MQYKVVKKHTGSLISTEGNPIEFDLYAPHNDTGSLPVVLFLHGFKGFKNWGTFPDAFFEMARNGFAVLAINFSHDGINHETTFVDKPDLFYSQTISQEIEDIRTVVDAVKSGKIAQNAGLGNLYPLGIIGHSRGGLTAVIAAAEIDDIACLVTWAAVSDSLDYLGNEVIQTWSNNGYTEITNSRTGQTLKIGKQFIDDLTTNRDKLSAERRAKELYIPCLFIHGTNDETVHYLHAQKLHEACSSNEKEKYIIEGATHTFGGSHPFDEENLPEHFAEVVNQTIRWFQIYLI